MKLTVSSLVACVILGIVLAAEEEKEPELNWWQKALLWIDDRQTETFGGTANDKPGDECLVSDVGYFPDPAHVLGTYYGDAQTAAVCYDGLAVFGGNFWADWYARSNNAASLKDELLCCLKIKCGPDLTGYCTTQGFTCKDIGVNPLPTSKCPGSYSQCCPTLDQKKSDASTGDDTNLFALGDAGPDIYSAGESPLALAPPGGDLASNDALLPQGSLNPGDPLGGENLFLANDNTDSDSGLVASLDDSMAQDSLGGLGNAR